MSIRDSCIREHRFRLWISAWKWPSKAYLIYSDQVSKHCVLHTARDTVARGKDQICAGNIHWWCSLRNYFCMENTATVSRDRFFLWTSQRQLIGRSESKERFLLDMLISSVIWWLCHVSMIKTQLCLSWSPFIQPPRSQSRLWVCRCICKLPSLWGIRSKHIYLSGKPNKWDNRSLYLREGEIA